MTRLFTALWPPASAVAQLDDALGQHDPPGWRRLDTATWHLTLAFHGEADADELAGRLQRAVSGVAVPRLRIAGAGAFPGVRWAGVEAAPVEALHALVAAAGGDVDGFVPHVTLLRRASRSGPARGVEVPSVRGPWWRPDAVLLVASERTGAGARYSVVHRAPLA